MRLSKYINEVRTVSRNQLNRMIDAIHRVPSGDRKDNMAVEVMDAIDDIRTEFIKMFEQMGGIKGKLAKDFENAYFKVHGAVGEMAKGKSNPNIVKKLYQNWINITTGITNALDKKRKR